MLKDQIIKLMDEKKLVEVYTDNDDTDHFDCGKFITYNDNFYVMENVSKNGVNDGLFLGKSEKIYCIEYDSKYLNKISLLADDFTTLLKQNEIDSANPLSSILLFILQNQRITEIELVDSGNFDVTGFVTSFDEEFCTVKVINKYAELDGTAMIKLKDISMVSCGSEYECRIEKLYKIKNS